MIFIEKKINGFMKQFWNNSRAIKYVDKSLLKNYDDALALVNLHGKFLKYVDKSFMKNENFVIAALKS